MSHHANNKTGLWTKLAGGALVGAAALGLGLVWRRQAEVAAEEAEAEAAEAEARQQRKEAVDLCAQAVQLNAKGKPTEALQAINQAVALSPDEPRFYTNRALILMKKRRYAQAAEDATTSLELGGAPSKALYVRGRARMEMGDTEAAVKDFEEAASVNDNKQLTPLISAKLAACRVRQQEALEEIVAENARVRAEKARVEAEAKAQAAEAEAKAQAATEAKALAQALAKAEAEQQQQEEEEEEAKAQEEAEAEVADEAEPAEKEEPAAGSWEPESSMESSLDASMMESTATTTTSAPRSPETGAAAMSWANVTASGSVGAAAEAAPAESTLFASADQLGEGDAAAPAPAEQEQQAKKEEEEEAAAAAATGDDEAQQPDAPAE